MTTNKLIHSIYTATLSVAFGAATLVPCTASAQKLPESVEAKTIRSERNLIREGNALYAKKNYAEAEVKYRQAISANKDSEVGLYNLALSLLRQAGPNEGKDNPSSPIHQADSIFHDFVSISKNQQLLSRAYYNMGNIAFNNEQYDQSVEMYKNALRRNPNDDQARDNLRLAQKKLEQQQNQDQQDQDDKNDEKQDQQQDQKQDQQDQNKDQQDQQQNKDQQQNQDQQQQQQQSAAPDNSEQILNAVQNNERTTQQKVNAQKAKEQEMQRSRIKNQW